MITGMGGNPGVAAMTAGVVSCYTVPSKDRLKDKGHAVKRRGEESVSPFAHSWDIRTTILYW